MTEATMLLALDGSVEVLRRAAPALCLAAGVLALVVAFAIRNLAHGSYHDEQVGGRGSTAIVGMWFRQCFAWGMQPVIHALLWSKLPPAAITALALLLAVGSGAALATGHFTLGAVLFIVSGLCDFLDGRIARHQGIAGPGGALLDSVVDRYVEVVIFAGLAWYYRDSWVLAAVLAATAGSVVVPYVRARGESLGVDFPNIGIVQRPERFAILGASLLFSPIVEIALPSGNEAVPQRLLVFGIVLLAVTTTISASQRLLHGLRTLAGQAGSGLNYFGKGSLFRNATVGAMATALDFALVLALVELVSVHPALATLLGCAFGAIVNFLLNGLWTFERRQLTPAMAGRYAFVSSTSAGINSGLVGILLMLPSMPYVAVWWIARGLVFLLWNYPLHRDYVFAATAPQQPQPEAQTSAEARDDDEAVPPSGLIHVEVRQ